MPLRDIRGHRRLIALLARSIEHDALPPASIFAGPSPDKSIVAIAVAQALNCLKPNAGDACGKCTACVRIERRTHPDVPVVVPNDKGNISIDDVRAVLDSSTYRPFEGRRRVAIIEEADGLTVPAQGSLLKNLEEPSPSSIFILVTARPDSLLATVRSRCIRLWFPQIGAADVDANARAVAERVLGLAATRDDVHTRLNAAKDLLSNTGKGGASDRQQLSEHLRAMAALLRDAEILATGADPAAIVNRDSHQALEAIAAAYRGERGVRAFAAVDQGLVALDRNAGVKVVADWVALQL